MLHRHIRFTCLQFNTLYWTIGCVLFQFNHLLILWTSSLLWYSCLPLLVGRWLRFGALESMLADAVVDKNSSQETSQNSNNKYNDASNCCWNLHSRTCAKGCLYIICWIYIKQHNNYHTRGIHWNHPLPKEIFKFWSRNCLNSCNTQWQSTA